MAAPTLRIPVALNLSGLKSQVEEASQSVTKTVGNIVRSFNTANSGLNRIGLGVTPMKLLEVSAKGTSAALQGVSTGLGAVGNAANSASKTVPQLKAIGDAANVAALATSGLAKTATGVGVAARAADEGVSWFNLIKGVGLATAAFVIMSGAIKATIAQLEKMVDVFDRATNVGVGTDFFQQFLFESQKMKVSADDLEEGLSRAFKTLREVDPIDLSKWETGEEKINDVEKALRVYNATGEKLKSLVLFRDAQDQEERIIAILKAMQELEGQGRKIQALTLGESVFGSKFVDNIRTGKTSIDSIIQSMEKAKEAGSGVIPADLAKRAKEVNTELLIAQNTLDREMRPVWNDLARTLQEMKSTWATIIGYIAQGVRLINQFELTNLKSDLKDIQQARATGTSLIGTPRVPEAIRSVFGANETIDQRLAKREQDVKARIEELEGNLRPKITVRPPSRGEGARPTKKNEGEDRDRFDSAIDAAEKRAAALEAETNAIDLNAAARERAKLVAELETVAKQVNTAAGKENTDVTAEQAKRITEVADAYEKAAKASENAKGPLRTYARESLDASKQIQEGLVNGLRGLEDSLVDIITNSKTAEEAFRKLANSLIQDLIRIGIRLSITGPLASAFGSALGLGGGASPFGVSGFGKPSLPTFAEGGFLGAGKWGIAGENGPELIKGPAQIVPNFLARGGAGGGSSEGMTVVVNSYNAEVQTEQRDNKSLEITVRGLVRDELAGASTNSILRNKYGISPRGIARA